MELHQVKNKTFLMEYGENATLSLNLLCFWKQKIWTSFFCFYLAMTSQALI